MKISLNWIREFVEVKASPQEIADRLTLAGLEIEKVEDQGRGLDKVVTATILKRDKHPNADRLSLCEVRVGSQIHSIVCGADNMKAGDRIALALPGAVLPNGMAIQETVIRKVKSGGMLCSEKELGLKEESQGILILSQEIPEGLPLAQALKLEDVFFEVNVTPNRGDCLSVLGLAREVAASFKVNLKVPNIGGFSKALPESLPVKVLNEASELCPRYTCRILRGVKVAPSPEWVQRRLESCGIRAINNVVDATNYVLLERGQPQHAFDLSQIRKSQIVIRKAKAGEKMKTLDALERNLNADDLVIADGERILAIAGVMGGEDSGVEASTKDLLLESACFAPEAVRKTSKRLGLQTESSYRFERGVDPNGCRIALDRLAELILEWAGGEVLQEAADSYPTPLKPIELTLRSERLEKVLGEKFSFSQIQEYLRPLGIDCREGKAGPWNCIAPTFRPDLTREIDLVEEVARIHGYNKIPTTFPKLALDEIPPSSEHPIEGIYRILAAWGFCGVMNYSFSSPSLLKKFYSEIPPDLCLMNPISEELSVMRPSLLPSLTKNLRDNYYWGNKALKLFEIAPVFSPGKSLKDKRGESLRLCLGMLGPRRGLHFQEKPEKADLLDLKGYLQAIFGPQISFFELSQGEKASYWHPKRCLGLKLDGHPAGVLGELHPGLAGEMDLNDPVALAEINLDLFLTESKNKIQFKDISPFPSIERDLNLILAEGTSHGDVLKVLGEMKDPWIRKIELFDLYRGAPLPEGKKALTYRIEYGDAERTLTDAEVNQARERLLSLLNQKLGATLR